MTREAMDEAEREAGDVGRRRDLVLLAQPRRRRRTADAPITPVLTWRQARADVAPSVPLDSGRRPRPHRLPAAPELLADEDRRAATRRACAPRASSRSRTSCTGGRTSLSMASGTGPARPRRAAGTRSCSTRSGSSEAQLPELADELVLGDGAAANLGSGALGWRTGALHDRHVGGAAAPCTSRALPGRVSSSTASTSERVVEGGSISDGGNLLDWLERLLGIVETEGLAADPPRRARLPALLGGERSPGWRARRARRGLRAHVRDDAAGPRPAALEGVAYRLAEIADSCPSSRRSSARAARSSTTPTGRRSSPTCSSCR